jgi:hypothetical protein
MYMRFVGIDNYARILVCKKNKGYEWGCRILGL